MSKKVSTVRDYSSDRAEAAKWMYERKGRPVDWWRSKVLTKHNKDPETLGLDEKTAVLIYADLVRSGLLVPILAPDGDLAYTIHDGKEKEWKRAMSPWQY